MAAYIFKLQVTNLSFDRRTFCTSLSSVEIHFQLNRYFTTFIVFSTSRLFIYLCTKFIKRIIHNLICSDALCMRNNVQGTFYIMFCKFMQFNKNFKTIFEYIRKKFRFVHTNTFCEYRKKLRASPRVHLVSSKNGNNYYIGMNLNFFCKRHQIVETSIKNLSHSMILSVN